MDHTFHTPLEAYELNAINLLDAPVYGRDDYKIGTVTHVHDHGSAVDVVIDVGGFLGIGAKPVAIPASDLNFMRGEDGSVHAVTTWTKDELRELPEHVH